MEIQQIRKGRGVLLLCLLLWSVGHIHAQNLVKNPGFEEACTGQSIPSLCDWYDPGDGTPDNFADNSISSGGNCGFFTDFTENLGGWTTAFDGNEYCGFLAYYIQGGQQDSREYLQVELTEPLEAGRIYEIGFRAKYGSKSSYAVSHFGMHLSTTPVGPTNIPLTNDLMDVVSHADFNAEFSDTLNWELIQGTYVAQGNEFYVTIGNFYSDEDSNVIPNPAQSVVDPTCLLSYYGAYYYVDGVYVEKTLHTTSTIVETACNSYISPSGNNYWTSSGIYQDTIPNSIGGDSIITIDLTINTVTIGIVLDGHILTSEANSADYQWIDCEDGNNPIVGETNQSFTATSTGSYAVVVTENECIDTSECVSVMVVSVADNTSLQEISISPNPTQGYLSIDLGEKHSFLQVKIISVNGQTIFEERLRNTQTTEMEIDGPSGVYYLQLTDNKGGSATYKIFKE